MWAIVIVVKPRPDGQPMAASMATKSSSRDRPVMTSGMTRGAVTMPVNRVRPRKRRNRASTNPAIVPRAMATVAFRVAIRRLIHAAWRIWSFSSRAPYHWVENPAQTVTSLDLLKE